MAQPTTTFLEELMAAAQGVWALLIGNRQAPAYFDFSQRGLVGSVIALVLSVALQALGPQALGLPTAPGAATGAIILAIPLLGLQFGVAWLILRQLGRLDGFIPFLVAACWAALFEAVILVAMQRVFGTPIEAIVAASQGEIPAIAAPLFMLGVAGLVIAVNIARLIVTLSWPHIVLFVAAQMIAGLVGPYLLGALI